MVDVLVFSDSLCAGLKLSMPHHVESLPGAMAEDAAELLDALLKEDIYDIVVICFGINDLGNGRTTSAVISDLLNMHDICRQNGITKIIGMTLPKRYDSFNDLYTSRSSPDVLCNEFFFLVESKYYKDGLHLTRRGLKKLAESLEETMQIFHMPQYKE